MLTKTARADTIDAEITQWSYDQARTGFYNVGQMTTAANPAAAMEYNYDNEGRLANQAWIVDSVTYTTTQAFDTGGRLLWREYPDSDSVGSSGNPFLYDSSGRLKTVPGLVSTILYNARSQETSLTRANGAVTTSTYSAQRGWLLSLQTVANSTTIQSLTYSRGANGRINSVSSIAAGENWTYGGACPRA